MSFKDVVAAVRTPADGGISTNASSHRDVLKRINLPNPNASGMYDRRFLVPGRELLTQPTPVGEVSGNSGFATR
jgi:hypothetical protein